MSTNVPALDVYNPTKVLNSALSILGPNPSSLIGEEVSSIPRDLTADERLFTLLCNYLSLSQFELARPIITELFFACPDRITNLLRAMITKRVPDQWLLSNTVPTVGHLQWLALVEYGQLYANVFDKPVSLTPSIPLVVGSKDTRFTSLAQSDLVLKNPVNPLGFITHDQLVLQVFEANLRKSSGTQLYTKVYLEGEGNENATGASTDLTAAGHAEFIPPVKHRLGVNIADAKITITVYSTRPLVPGVDPASIPNSVVKGKLIHTLVGKAMVDLHQLRAKEKYHIWVPIVPMDAEDTPTAEKQLGRLRIRIRWKQVDLVPRRDGSARLFDDKTMWLMETDLVLAHASVAFPTQPSEKASAKEPLLRAEHISELRSYCLAAVGRKDYSQLVYQNSEESVAGEEANLKAQFTPTHRVQHSLPALRRVVREHPTLGHTLCSHLAAVRPQDPTWVYLYAELIFEMLLRQEYPQALQALTTLAQDIYPGDDFYAGLTGVSITVGDQASGPRAMIREVYRAMVHYIHDDKNARQHLMRLLTHKRLVTGQVTQDRLQELSTLSTHDVLAAQRQVLARKCRVYGSLMGNEQMLRQFCALEDYYLHGSASSNSIGLITMRTTGAKPTAATGAATGEQQGKTVPGMVKDGVVNDVPLFFKLFADAIAEADRAQKEAMEKLGVSAEELPPHIREPLFAQREDAFAAFWNEYYSFIRVRKQHVFEFPIKAVLEFIALIARIHLAPAWHAKGHPCVDAAPGALNMYEKLELLDVLWSGVDAVLAPFNMLRPMVLLLAWDRVEQNFELRKQLVSKVWKPYRPALATALALCLPVGGTADDVDVDEVANAVDKNAWITLDDSPRARVAQRYECAEPKLVLHCARLEFCTDMTDLILTSVPSVRSETPEQQVQFAQHLLNQMNSDSCVKALHPYLLDLDPGQVVGMIKAQIDRELDVDYIDPSHAGHDWSTKFATVIASWTEEQRALFAATGLAPDGQILDPVLTAKIVNNETNNAIRRALQLGPITGTPMPGSAELQSMTGDPGKVNNGALQHIRDSRIVLQQAAVTDLVHDLHVLCAYYALRCVLTLIKYEAQSRRVAESEKIELLDAARAFLMAMQYRSYQIATAEKMYCLLFIMVTDLKTSVAMQRDADDDDIVLDEEDDEDTLDIDLILTDRNKYKSKLSRFVLRGPTLNRLLSFLSVLVKDLQGLTTRDNVTRTFHRHEQDMLLERLYQLNTQLMEAQWRAATLSELASSESSESRKLSARFTMAHITAPLHYISAYLMHKEKIEEAVVLFPPPTLPPHVAAQARSAEKEVKRGTEELSQLYTTAHAAFPGLGSDGVETTTTPEHLQRLCEMLRGGYSALSSQVAHASTLAHDSKLWLQCCSFVEGRMDDLIESSRVHQWDKMDDSAVKIQKVREYTDAILSRKAKELSQGAKPTAADVITVAADLQQSQSSVDVISAKHKSNSPHRFVDDLDQYIEQHVSVGVGVAADDVPTQDVLLEIKYLIAIDLAIAYASKLPVPHYRALLDRAMDYADGLKTYCETALFTYMSDAALASLSAAVFAASDASKTVVANILNSQDAIRRSLHNRIRLCELFIHFAHARQTDKDGVAVSLIPTSITGDVPDLLSVPENLYLRAWQQYAGDINHGDGLLPACPWSGDTALRVMRHLVVSVTQDAIVTARNRANRAILSAKLSSTTAIDDGSASDDHVLGSLNKLGSRGHVDACTYVIDGHTQGLLTRALMPALVAVRFGLRCAVLEMIKPRLHLQHKSNASALDQAVAIALHYSRGLPTLSKWVHWRVGAYRKVAQWVELVSRVDLRSLEPSQEGTTFQLVPMSQSASNMTTPASALSPEEVRTKVEVWMDMLAKENAYRDQLVYRALFLEYAKIIAKCEVHTEKLIISVAEEIEKASPEPSPEPSLETITALSRSSSVLDSPIVDRSRRQLTALRLSALELADACLDDDAMRHQVTAELLGDAQTARKSTLNVSQQKQLLMEALVMDLSEDMDQPLRAQLLMRLDDPVKAAELAVMWLPRWHDTDMCAAVAMRTFASITSHIHTRTKHFTLHPAEKDAQASAELATWQALQQKLAKQYQVLIMFRALEHAANANSKQRMYAAHAFTTGTYARYESAPSMPLSSLVPVSLYHRYPNWVSFEEEIDGNVEQVVDVLLSWQMLGVALKVYSMRMLPITDPEVAQSLHAISGGLPIRDSEFSLDDKGVRRRWYFGQELLPMPLSETFSATCLPNPGSSSGGLSVGIVDAQSQIEFPLSMYSTWLSVMSAKEAELKATPEGFSAEEQAMQLRLAVKLESTCLAVLLAGNSPARSHLRAIQRIHELDAYTPAFSSIQSFHIMKFLVVLLDNAHSRLVVTDILHKRWAATAEQLRARQAAQQRRLELGEVNIDEEDDNLAARYPALPRHEALWLVNAYAAAQMLGMLPTRIQDALCLNNIGGADGTHGMGHLCSPNDIVHGLFILGQPRLVSSIFHRFAHLFSARTLVARASAIFTGTFNQHFAAQMHHVPAAPAAPVADEEHKAATEAHEAEAYVPEPYPVTLPLGMEVELELGFYYLDLVLQYKLSEADALTVGVAILDIVQTLLDDDLDESHVTVRKLTNRIVGPKLLKYFDTHCSNIKSPELQARYTYLAGVCLGTAADVESLTQATREGAIDVDPDFLGGTALGLEGMVGMGEDEDEDEDWFDEDEDEIDDHGDDDFETEGVSMFEDEDDPEEAEVDYD